MDETKESLTAMMYAIMLEAEGMKVTNEERKQNDLAMAYGEDAFFGLSQNLEAIAEKFRNLK